MTATTESKRDLAFLVSEAPGTLSRETVTIASGAGALPAGRVLGKVTSSGEYISYDDDNDDGSETAAAVLCHAVDATSAAVSATVIFRLAEVNSLINWASTNDSTDIANGVADLAAKYIIIR